MDLTAILSLIIATGVIVGGLGYLFGQFRKGQSKSEAAAIKSNQDVLNLMQDQIESLQKIATENKVQIAELQKKISVLEAVNKEKDGKIAEYMQILQNRNPEMAAFMKEVLVVVGEAKNFMKTQSEGMTALLAASSPQHTTP